MMIKLITAACFESSVLSNVYKCQNVQYNYVKPLKHFKKIIAQIVYNIHILMVPSSEPLAKDSPLTSHLAQKIGPE